jgi:hypothetical protein
VLDGPFDNATTVFLSEGLVVQVRKIGPEECESRPQNRKSRKEVAEELFSPGVETKIRDASHFDEFRERKHGDPDGYEYQAKRWKRPSSKARIQNVEHFDEVGAHCGPVRNVGW